MILVKTETGHQVLKDRSVRLTPRQRSAFILFDGRRSVDEVLEAGMGIAREDIEHLIQLGLLGQIVEGTGISLPTAPAPMAPAPIDTSSAPSLAWGADSGSAGRSPQQRYKDAYPLATQLTASLGLRGFRLNLAVEGTTTFDELRELFPRIQSAVGADKAAILERALMAD